MRKLKQSLLLVLLVLMSNIFTQSVQAQDKVDVDKWLITSPFELKMPVFNNDHDVNGNEFTIKSLLTYKHVERSLFWPENGDIFQMNAKKSEWKIGEVEDENQVKVLKSKKIKGIQVAYATHYVEVDRWMNAKLEISSTYAFEVMLDGKVIGKKTSLDKDLNTFSKSVELEQGKHIVVVKMIVKEGHDKDLNISAKYSVEEPATTANLIASISPKRRMDISHVLDGPRVGSLVASPDASYYIVRFSERYAPEGDNSSWYEIYETGSNQMVVSLKGMDLWNLNWIPGSNKLSYITNDLSGSKIVSFDFEKGTRSDLLNNTKRLRSYQWSGDASFLIYSVSERANVDNELVKKVEGMPDRWPWYRNRSFLYKYDVASDFSERLTFGNLTTSLHDISPDGKYIIYSTSKEDYMERPYSKQKLFMMNLETFENEEIWHKRFPGSASFCPSGKNLLVLGSPATFGDIGINTTDNALPNDYDQQAYIYNIESKDVKAITKDFDPAIRNAYWSKIDGNIYFVTWDKTFVSLYKYDVKGEAYSHIDVGMDIIKNMSFSTEKHIAVYAANGIKNRDQGYMIDLNTLSYTLVQDPEEATFDDVIFGKHEEWVFTTKEGTKIDGRVYYPPNFDPNKKYPLIVNYYAGTSPVSRSFRGRYPLNLYAAGDYIVYNLQPSGTYGYGQDFSAAHVNNWGATVADEIIDATKQFVAEHEFVNGERIGCIGASYGGFMTMYLLSKTDIFTCGISHAGISSLSSYWGEGYWGYLYSSVASANSFPWNNKELYIEQGALFNADKIKDALLLLHGDEDTNVPVGESIQLYTALKLLGRPVDFIEIKGQDHHILDYKKRVIWQKTIAAYFDRWLKDQPEWWDEMYPKPNY